MAQQVLDIVAKYGLETVSIALCVNLLTALIKWPIKKLASKCKNSARITRFIVFLPIVLGLALAAVYTKWIAKSPFGKEFITLWLTASSLSLTFYAVFEKLIPPQERVEANAELQASKEILSTIQTALQQDVSGEKKVEQNAVSENEKETNETCAENSAAEKIILRGKRND